jgi:hypothetical protein
MNTGATLQDMPPFNNNTQRYKQMTNNLNISLLNVWFGDNYLKLYSKFYDRDALHDSICVIYKLAYANKIDVESISAEMLRMYYNKCVQRKSYASLVYMLCEDSTMQWIIDKEHADDEEEEEPDSKDWYGVLESVKKKMKRDEAKLLDLYLKGFSMEKIAMVTGMGASTVKKKIFNRELWDCCS